MTVRQTPLTATLSPTPRADAIEGASRPRRRPAPAVSIRLTMPSVSTSPVNMSPLTRLWARGGTCRCLGRRHRAAEKPGDIVTHRHAQGVQPEDRHHHQFTNEDQGCDKDNHLHQVAEMPAAAKNLLGEMRLRNPEHHADRHRPLAQHGPDFYGGF